MADVVIAGAAGRMGSRLVALVQEEKDLRLVGAVEALDIGDPLDFATDVGPVIDRDAMERLDVEAAKSELE